MQRRGGKIRTMPEKERNDHDQEIQAKKGCLSSFSCLNVIKNEQ